MVVIKLEFRVPYYQWYLVLELVGLVGLQGHSQRRDQGGRAPPPQSSTEWIYYGKNWLCWDVGPALFSKVTLFSLPEVFCGPQICQKCVGGRAPDPAEITTPPDPLVSWGVDIPSPIYPPPRNLRHLDSRAKAVADSVKSWLSPCMVRVTLTVTVSRFSVMVSVRESVK